MFDRFFDRFNTSDCTRGFNAEGYQHACADNRSANVNSLLSLDTALAVSIFVALCLALIIIGLVGILVLVRVLICILAVLSVVIIIALAPQRPRLASAS